MLFPSKTIFALHISFETKISIGILIIVGLVMFVKENMREIISTRKKNKSPDKSVNTTGNIA